MMKRLSQSQATFSLLGAFGFVLIIWGLKLIASAFFTPLAKVPGPWYAKFTHYVLKWHVVCGRRLYYIHEQHLRYGPIVRIAPNEVDVADIDSFKEIHRVGSGFLKSSWYSSFRGDVVDMFSTQDVKLHSARRKMLSRPFSNTALRENWEDWIRERAQFTVARIKAEALQGDSDVLKWWTLLTTDVIAQLSFGHDFGALDTGERTQYITDLDQVMMTSGIGAELNPLMRWILSLPLSFSRSIYDATKRVEGYGKVAVTNARGKDAINRTNVFSGLFADNEKGASGHGISDKDLATEATSFIVAGSGTTAITLTYLTWAVLRHSDVQFTLEQEVGRLTADFKDADLEKLPVLNAVIDETLRLYGAAPGSLPRIVPPGGATLGGYYLPGGATVCTQAYTLHRDSSIFPNPYQFNYKRFLPENTLKTEQKAAFSPFGAGSRVCLGLHLARIELRHAVASLFRECKGLRLSMSTTDEDMEIVNFFLITPKGGMCNVTLRI